MPWDQGRWKGINIRWCVEVVGREGKREEGERERAEGEREREKKKLLLFGGFGGHRLCKEVTRVSHVSFKTDKMMIR